MSKATIKFDTGVAAPVCTDESCAVPAAATSAVATATATAPAATAAAAADAKQPAKQVLTIEVTTDPICPWCYVGHRRLEKALALLDKTKVEVKKSIKPFFLDPTLPTKSVNKLDRYTSRFGADRVKHMLPHMQQVGKAEGIAFSYGGRIGNTLNAHRLLQWAADPHATKGVGGPAVQEALLLTLYRGYFEQEQDVADVDMLVNAAAEVGLDKTAARAFLASDALTASVQQSAQANLLEHGISGVPFFVLQNQYAVSGAQDASFFVNVFKRIGLPLVAAAPAPAASTAAAK